MQAIFIYLFKVIACSGLLLGYYWIALRNKQFHQYNRFYLLSAVLLSLFLPLLQLDWFIIEPENTAAAKFIEILQAYNTDPVPLVVETAPVTASAPALSWEQITAGLLLLGSLFCIVRLAFRIYAIYRVKSRYPCTRIDPSVQLVETDLQDAPFSFLSYLFWRNDLDLNDATGQQIWQHELTHILQKHTWDKLFLQAVLCLLWMNPFFWLLQRELNLVHEFIADKKAVQDKDTSAFAAMLLHARFGKFAFAPAHPFFYSPIKRRLLMLTTSNQSRYSYARRIMVLPLLVAISVSFALKIQAQQKKDTAAAQQAATASDTSRKAGTVKVIPDIEVTGYKIEKPKTTSDTTRKRLGTYKGKEVKDIFINTDHTKVILTLADHSTRSLSYDEALKNNLPLPRVVIGHPSRRTTSATGVDSTAPVQKTFSATGVDSTAPAAVTFSGTYHGLRLQPFAIAQSTGSTAAVPRNNWPAESLGMVTPTPAPDNTDKASQPLLIVDKKEVDFDKMKDMAPEHIEAINVIKGKDATERYGDKGKNGVIEITLKEISKDPNAKPTANTTVSARFPGGLESWQAFVKNNLRTHTPLMDGAIEGVYTVIVSFNVETDGSLTNIKAENHPGYGMEKLAVQLLEKSPKWTPAIKKGTIITSRVWQPVRFDIVPIRIRGAVRSGGAK